MCRAGEEARDGCERITRMQRARGDNDNTDRGGPSFRREKVPEFREKCERIVA